MLAFVSSNFYVCLKILIRNYILKSKSLQKKNYKNYFQKKIYGKVYVTLGQAKSSCVVPLLNCVQLFVTPWTAAHQASLSFTISQSLLKFMSIESPMLSNHLILCWPLLLLPSIFPSIRVFSSELALHIRWPKYRSVSISLSNEYSGLISFRIDWFDLLAFQEFF